MDQSAVDIAEDTWRYAGYASLEEQHILQTCVVTLGGAADVQIRRALSKEESFNLESKIVISLNSTHAG